MRISLRFYFRIVIVLAVVATLLTAWGVIRGDLRFGDSPVPAATVASPAAPSTGTAGSDARGCLGGENAEAAVLVAQEKAPLTPAGAAEFTATLIRWTWIYPRTKPLKEDGVKLWAPDIVAEADKPRWPNASNGDSAYASFIDGHYLIESVSADTAVVSVQFISVYSSAGGQMDTNSSAVEVTVKAVDGRWRLGGGRKHRQPDDIIAQGQSYRQGC